MSIGGLAGTLLAGLSQAPQAYQQAQESQRRQQALDLALQDARRKQAIQDLLGRVDLSAFGSPGGLPGAMPAMSPVNAPPSAPMPGQASVPAQPSQSQYDPALAVQNEVNAEPYPAGSYGPPAPPPPQVSPTPGGASAPPAGAARIGLDRNGPGGRFIDLDTRQPLDDPPQHGAAAVPGAPPPAGGSASPSAATGGTGEIMATLPGGGSVPLDGILGHHVDLGQVQKAIRAARPNADPATAWGATVELYKQLQTGDKAQQLQSAALLRYLGVIQGFEARKDIVNTQQAGATARTGAQIQSREGIAAGASADRRYGVDTRAATAADASVVRQGMQREQLDAASERQIRAIEARAEQQGRTLSAAEERQIRAIEARATEGAANRESREAIAGQQTGSRERVASANRDAAMQRMQTREGRIDARMALRQADQNARAALVAGDRATHQKIMGIRAQIAQIAAKNPGGVPSEADQKRLDDLGKQLAELSPAPAQPQQ